jgi:hypothetical protein
VEGDPDDVKPLEALREVRETGLKHDRTIVRERC